MKESQISILPNASQLGIDGFRKYSDIVFALSIIGMLLVLLFPVPSVMLDILLAISITFSIIILMTCLFIIKPLEFSVFPTILLISALLRLALNIASTRLILSKGHQGTVAAGKVIEAFGNFVMEGNIVIGIIVFIILTIINFVVITKGSGRIAEVAARFSLDAMPGKQMAIDADLSAGLIDEETAKQRRKEIEDESTFFGAMDGANKFVRGDAIAGLLITFINFIAGIIIGVVQKDLSFSKALNTYTILTIGDGLVAQIPSLIVSLAAGLLVSKSGIIGSTDKVLLSQLGKYPQTMFVASMVAVLMSIMPGLPALPFLFIALGLAAVGYGIKQNVAGASEEKDKKTSSDKKAQDDKKEQDDGLIEALHIDNIKLELGYNLLPLINYTKGHKLTDQIKALRKQVAKDLGFIMPSVRIQDNLQLGTNNYVIKIKDIECASGEIHPAMLLVMDPKGQDINLPGIDTLEPAFGLSAKWIEENLREEALAKEYTVVDPPTVITTHLTEIIKENVVDLLSYSEVQKLINDVPEENRKLVDDVIPSQVSITNLQRILQNLLSESVSVKDLPLIIEAAAEAIKMTNNINLISEYVRTRLSRQISSSNLSNDGILYTINLSPEWEQIFNESLTGIGDEKQLTIAPSKVQDFVGVLKKEYERIIMEGVSPVLVVHPNLRIYIKNLLDRFRLQISVLSQAEIHPKIKTKTIGQL